MYLYVYLYMNMYMQMCIYIYVYMIMRIYIYMYTHIHSTCLHIFSIAHAAYRPTIATQDSNTAADSDEGGSLRSRGLESLEGGFGEVGRGPAGWGCLSFSNIQIFQLIY